MKPDSNEQFFVRFVLFDMACDHFKLSKYLFWPNLQTDGDGIFNLGLVIRMHMMHKG